MDKSDAARLLGMPESEIVEVVQEGDGLKVRTADGATTGVTYDDRGQPVFTLLAVAGPPGDAGKQASEEMTAEALAEPEPDVTVLPDGSATEVLAWAGDDPDRLRQALDAEQAKDQPRSTLVARLSASLGEPVRTTED